MSQALACTPSELLSAVKCVKCGSEHQLVAALVYALSQESDYALPSGMTDLLHDSACFTCMSDKQMLDALVNLFANRYLSNAESMASIVNSVQCLSCATPAQVRAALLYLICQNFMNPYILDSGKVALDDSAITVASAFASATNPILLTYEGGGATFSVLNYSGISEGISFQISSSTPNDFGTVSWAIIRG